MLSKQATLNIDMLKPPEKIKMFKRVYTFQMNGNRAEYVDEHGGKIFSLGGNTPEEATARLVLALIRSKDKWTIYHGPLDVGYIAWSQEELQWANIHSKKFRRKVRLCRVRTALMNVSYSLKRLIQEIFTKY